PPPPKKSRPEPIDQDEVVTSARLLDETDKAAPSDPFADLQSSAPTPGASPAAPALTAPSTAVAPTPPAMSAGAMSSPALAASAQPALGAAQPPLAPPAAPPQPVLGAGAAPPGFPGTPLGASAPMPPAPAGPAIPAMAPTAGLTDDLEWPQRRSKKPLIVGAVGVLAVVVVAWLLLSGESEESTVPEPVNTQTQAATPTQTSPAPP